jgi:hypothetical protein
MRKYRIVVRKTSYAIKEIQIDHFTYDPEEDAKDEARREAYVQNIWPESEVDILLVEKVV